MYIFKESLEELYDVFASHDIIISKSDRILSQKEIDQLRDKLFELYKENAIEIDFQKKKV